MSSLAIEAKSLSSLSALAANPPSYPRNPTHVRNEPLVLYIARVPGSRDVFLSPMKPREKVVTAEDIQSSLYFVHVDQADDARYIEPPAPEFQEPNYGYENPTASQQLPAPAVQRKAVPQSVPTALQPSIPPAGARRKPVPGTLTPVNNFESRQNAHATNYLNKPSTLGPDYNPRRSFDSLQYQREDQRPPAQPTRRSFDQPMPAGTSLTLIRRDPSTSAQWNIARIEDPPTFDMSSSNLYDARNKKKVPGPMYIEVTNPGYSKFLHTDTEGNRPPLPTRPTNPSVNSYSNANVPPVSGRSDPEQPAQGSNTFRRRIWMDGLQRPNSGYGHQQRGSYDGNMGYDAPRDSFSSSSRPYDMQSERQPLFRGYVFMSPWNGRCEFITGGGGSSLKCRHVVPGLQGAPPTAMPVSELRFNLPSTLSSSSSRDPDSKRTSLFHRPRHHRHGSSYASSRNDDSTEDARSSLERLDLSLGQEIAGGGFGGKQAKLGKLIIEDEGLKMLDLLVAANVALWWRAYEKIY